MTPHRWKEVETVFEQVLALPAEERPSFFQSHCDGDEELRREVEVLLDSHGRAGEFLDRQSVFFTTGVFGEESALLSPGEWIGHYRIVRELGRGGMGAVYLAERADEQYKKRVAIKVIKRGMDTDAVLRQFRNERQILASFDHPNIGRLFDADSTGSGLPFFVMEYVEGLPIDKYCENGALSVEQRLRLFREVCGAVSYAHRHTVIHRDIKPSNILVTREGTPKLLDFGIAKLVQQGDDGAQSAATVIGLRPMTPQYASPEQMRGEHVTTASDVYSLGVVLYELLTGRLPYRFASTSPHEMSRAISETAPKKPSTMVAENRRESRIVNRDSSADGSCHNIEAARSDSRSTIHDSRRVVHDSRALRGDIDNILRMALRKEPERRYASVEQFSEDIRRHLEALPVTARKDTLRYRAGKFFLRNRAASIAAGLVLLSLIGGIIATASAAHRARVQEAAAKAATARAERRFNDVRKLAHSVLFDYHDAIKALPGATKVRELLVKDALSYLDSLAGEAKGDAELQRELAAAYERVGDVRGGTAGGSLGDLAGAVESYTKALRIREALFAANPNDAEARRDLAGSHYKIGRRLLGTAGAGEGEEHLRKARTLYLELTREQPANDELQLELAEACIQLANPMGVRGDFAGALEQVRAALAICERLAAGSPRDQGYRRELWSAHAAIGYTLWLQGDAAGAIEAHGREQAAGEALLAEDPINADYRRGLVVTYQHGGDYRKLSDQPAALEYFRKAIALDEELLAADAANARTRQDLAYTHKKMADLLAELQDNSQALMHYGKALESYEKVVRDAPADLTSRFLVATCRAGAAGMRARLGEVDPVLEECGKAIALLQETTGDKPGHVGRAQAYEYLGYAYLALAASPKASAREVKQRTSVARDMFRQSLDILDNLRSRQGPLGANEEWAKGIAGEVAKCETALAK